MTAPNAERIKELRDKAFRCCLDPDDMDDLLSFLVAFPAMREELEKVKGENEQLSSALRDRDGVWKQAIAENERLVKSLNEDCNQGLKNAAAFVAMKTRAETAEAELERQRPLIEAVMGAKPSIDHFRFFTRADRALIIIEAWKLHEKLKAREKKESKMKISNDQPDSGDLHDCSNGAGETKSCGVCDVECKARDEADRQQRDKNAPPTDDERNLNFWAGWLCRLEEHFQVEKDYVSADVANQIRVALVSRLAKPAALALKENHERKK